MIVAKFGGTSVSSRERVLTLCKIVQSEIKRKPVVVVSALSGVTNLLLSLPVLPKTSLKKEINKLRKLHVGLAKQLLRSKKSKDEVANFIDQQINKILQLLENKTFNRAFLDKLVSFGEIMSSFLIARVLNDFGIKAIEVAATNLIVTDNNFGSAEFLVGPTKKNVKKNLLPIINNGTVPVVTGFIASTRTGQISTLGRGGSDYTASILGFCLEAIEIQIWTDVDGILSSDPRVVKNARPLPTVSFKEASELAAFGARVLHPRTVRPAIRAGIPVKVLNTFNPKNSGTLIEEKSSSVSKIKAVSFKRKIILVNIYSTEMLWQKGFLVKIFKAFANHNIAVDLVSVSEVSVSVSLDTKENLEEVAKDISEFANVSVISDFGMVSLIGEGITSSSKTIKKIFDILHKEKILTKMVSLGATDINISIVLESEKIDKAVKALHDQLLLKQNIKNLKISGTIASK